MAKWVTLTEASKQLGVNLSKLSRMAARGRFAVRTSPRDERAKYVNIDELRKLFATPGFGDDEDDQEEEGE